MNFPLYRNNFSIHVLLGLAGLITLYFVQLRNYLLFHSFVELFSILVAFAVFIIVWNARAELDNPFLAVLGIGYLFIGGVDLIHTLAYRGMGVFPDAGANLPTQLWILARYLEAFTLLAAGLIGLRSLTSGSSLISWGKRALSGVILVYTIIVGLGLGSIFVIDVFPAAYIEGSGLTRFKIFSEYLIIVLLTLSLGLLYNQRETFDDRVFRFLSAAIVLTIGAELAFTLYVDVYGISNAIGHFFKLGSYYLIYLAVVKTGITDPHRTLYRELSAKEASARKFKQAVESAGHAVYMTSPEGTIEYVNPAFEAVTGYSAEEAVGRTPRILSSGEMSKGYYSRLWETIQAGEIWEEVVINQRKSGDRYFAEQTIAPVFDSSGTIERYVAIQYDITARKQREEQLSIYELAVEGSTDLLAAADNDYRLLFANKRYRDVHGLDEADIGDITIPEILDEDGFAKVKPYFYRATQGETVGFQMDRTTPDGDVLTLNIQLYPLADGDGGVQGVMASMRDLTELLERERFLRESEERYRSLTDEVLDTSEVGTIILDEEFRVVWLNQAIETYFGISRDAVLGEQIEEVVKTRFAPKIDKPDRFKDRVLPVYEDNTGIIQFEFHIPAGESHSERWLRHWSKPIETGLYTGGRIEHYTDISASRERERQLEVMDRILRHNLHNDMNLIMGHAELIRDVHSNGGRESAETIIQTGSKLLDTTDKEREVVKLLTRRSQLVGINLTEELTKIQRSLENTYPTATIRVECPSSVWVHAVPKLSAAITEVVANGIVHSTSDALQVDIRVEAEAEVVTLVVTDDGPGIPEEEVKVLLGEHDIEPLFHGSGLGLWLVKHVVQLSEGTLAFETNDSGGSTVSIRLPRYRPGSITDTS